MFGLMVQAPDSVTGMLVRDSGALIFLYHGTTDILKFLKQLFLASLPTFFHCSWNSEKGVGLQIMLVGTMSISKAAVLAWALDP